MTACPAGEQGWKKPRVWARSISPFRGWQEALGRGGHSAHLEPTPGLAAVPASVVSSKLLQYVLPGTSPEDHPGAEANENAAPDLRSQQRVPLGAKHGLWSLVPGSLPGASKQVEPRTQSHMQREGFRGGGGDWSGAPTGQGPLPPSWHCLGCLGSQAPNAFL